MNVLKILLVYGYKTKDSFFCDIKHVPSLVSESSNRFLCLFNMILALFRVPLPSDIRILQTHLVYFLAQS